LSPRRCVYLYRTRKSKPLLRVRLHLGLTDSGWPRMDPAVSAFRQIERLTGNVAVAGIVAICSCGKVFIPRRHKARSGITTPDRANLFQNLMHTMSAGVSSRVMRHIA
jgi:hypothetical protein